MVLRVTAQFASFWRGRNAEKVGGASRSRRSAGLGVRLRHLAPAENVRSRGVHLRLPHRPWIKLFWKLIEGEADGAPHSRAGLLLRAPVEDVQLAVAT
jgi:hypothetical protein